MGIAMPESLDVTTGVRRKPIQKRGQASLDRLLDATEELLLQRRFDEIPISDIVAKANSSVGVFYARFRNKADVLFALQERETERSVVIADQILESDFWRTMPLNELIAAAVTTVVDHFRRRRHVLAAIVALQLSEPQKYSTNNPMRDSLRRGVGALLEARKPTLSHPDPEAATLMALAFAFSFLDHLVAFDGLSTYGAYTLDDPRLEQELLRMLSLYLGVPPERTE